MKHFNMFHKAAADSEDKGELFVSVPQMAASEWKSIFTVKIFYGIQNPTGGIHFSSTSQSDVNINEDYGLSASEILPPPHMFTHNEVESARCWIPCMDRYSQPCTWNFQIRTHSCYTVVCTGTLLGTEKSEIIMNNDSDDIMLDIDSEPKKVELTTFYYKEDIPTTVKNIAITAGIFEVYPDPVISKITYFCLPGKMKMLKETIAFFHKVYQFYEEFLDRPFPYQSLKIVFVAHGYTKMSSFANLAIMSSHLLRDSTIIDKTLKSRWLLSLALSLQWFGNFVCVRSWSDMWLRFGLSSYLAEQFFQKMFGLNEYRLRQFKVSI